MQSWVTICTVSEANESLTAKDSARLQTFLPEVRSWFKKIYICDLFVTWNEKCCFSLSSTGRDKNVNKTLCWHSSLKTQDCRHRLFVARFFLAAPLMDLLLFMSSWPNSMCRSSKLSGQWEKKQTIVTRENESENLARYDSEGCRCHALQ